MDVISKLGLFLILFAVIVFGSKFLLSKKTRAELKVMKKDPITVFFQSQNRLLIRLIFVLVIVMIIFYIIFTLQ